LTDIEIYTERITTYRHLSDADAAKMIADNHGFLYSSVRGRLSRVKNTSAAKKLKMETLLSNSDKLPPSVQLQLSLIARSRAEFIGWSALDENRLGLFVSDLHMPYHRLDAYQLTMEIAYALEPHAISVLNDSLDNKGYGRHEDDSPIYKQLWRGDFANARLMQATYHRDLRHTLASGGKLLGLMGNHDRWLFNHWRSVTKQSAERMIATYMHELYYDDKVLLFSRGVQENSIHLSKGLVWVHGLSVAKNPNTLAKKAFDHYMENGVAKSVVQGHTHRPSEVYGDVVGYRGVKFVNSGHLRHDAPEWLVHKPKAWGMGIVACKYNPQQYDNDIQLIRYVEEGNKLVARYNGQIWAVPLDKKLPEYL
jgi:UDP-2,3-diacylglucosamine pyrophosphatase LpxH